MIMIVFDHHLLICIFKSLDEGIVDDVDNTCIQYSDDDVCT
jgi:hypothetical protein